MHGYGMDGWNMGWNWIFGAALIIALVVLLRGRRRG